MIKQPLWRAFDNASYDSRRYDRDPEDYQRGIEINKNKIVDNGDFDNEYETHCRQETLTARDCI